MEIEIKSQTIMFVAKILERLFGDNVPVEISATANGAALTAGSGSSAATLPLATARVLEVGEVVAEVGSLIRAVSAFPRREIVIASSDDSRAIVFADGMRLKLERELEKPFRPGACEKQQEAERKCVALREALDEAENGLFRWQSGSMNRDEHRKLIAMIKTALAATEKEGGAK